MHTDLPAGRRVDTDRSTAFENEYPWRHSLALLTKPSVFIRVHPWFNLLLGSAPMGRVTKSYLANQLRISSSKGLVPLP